MILNASDLRQRAKRVLPPFAFNYVDGGADDELTLGLNTRIFDRWLFAPAVLKDASQRTSQCRIGNSPLASPLLVAPTGYNGMMRHNADLMLARAAQQAGIGHIQSTVSTASIEEIAAAAPGERWFQLYVLKDRQVTADLIARAHRAGCTALVVSVDAVHFGNRERDKRHYRRPMKLSLTSLAQIAVRPGWVLRTLVPHGLPGFGNLRPYLPPELQKGVGGATYFAGQMEQALDWETIAWIRQHWQGPLYIKGVMTAEDALLARQHGAEGVVISNHGGRQLDGSLSPMQVLPAIRAAVGNDFTLLIDSGFRRGTDVVKAIALGANAVLLGRPLLYAVAVGGEAQVTATLRLLMLEIDRTLAQLGCTALSDLHPGLLTDTQPQMAAR